MSRVTFPLVINGFTISADYEQEDMETIFLPLLRKLSEFQKEKKTTASGLSRCTAGCREIHTG